MLEINNLNITFNTMMGEIKVMEDFNLKIEKGEKIGIIGESGSGKTSLALSIMGLCEGKVRGSIKFKGKELQKLQANVDGGLEENCDYESDDKIDPFQKIRGKEISMVYQNTGEVLNPVYTVIYQVMEPYLEHYPLNKKEAFERASYLLKKLGLSEGHFYSYPFYLSGGEVQKTLIAMALINDPDLLILDEPTSALDVITGAELLTFLEEVALEKTVIIISHDLSTVAQLAEKTTVLYAGKKMESGPTMEVLKSPAHPYTRALVRSYPTGKTMKDLQGIRGEFPSLTDPPAGCRFYGRCTQSLEKCQYELPPQVGVDSCKDWWIYCHREGIITLLEGQNITKTFTMASGRNERERDFNAVDGVNIDLKEGEVLAVVGESGSGKTTLGHILAGMLKPSEGKVYFNDFGSKDIYSLEGKEKKTMRNDLQLLYQNPHSAVSHRLMVHDILEEPLKIQGIKDKDVRKGKIKEALKLAGLSPDSFFTHKYPHELSGGELQRVTIARALVLEPRVLIADEPSAALDASVQAKILKLLLHLQNEAGFSLFLITHDIALAAKTGDRLAVMFNGMVVEKGPAPEIFNSPLHPYTKTLLELAPSLDYTKPGFKRNKFQLKSPVSSGVANEGMNKGAANDIEAAGFERFEGEVDLENGCGYYPYCEKAKKDCLKQKPRPELVDDFREVACHQV